MMIGKNGVSKLNIITTLCNQLVTTACGILIPHILIASFGSEAYGISVSITQFLSYITLLESGIGGVARAKLYGPLARNETGEISAVYHAIRSFFQWVAGAFLLYSLVLGFTYHDIAHVTVFSRPYIFALVLIIGLSTLAKYMGGLANLTLIVADQKQYINNLILMATTIANTVAIVILTRVGADLIWVKLGSSLIFVVRPVLYAIYVKKHYRLSRKGKAKAVLEQKWTGIGQHIAYFLHTNTDVVLLTLFANATLVAVYAVYNLIISSIRSISESFSGGMEAAFGEMIAKGQVPRLQCAYKRYKTLLVSVSGVLFSCTGILIVPFVQLYTRGIADADYVQPVFALILLMAEAINCMMLPCTSLPVAANHLKQTRWGAYGEAIINILLSCILVRWNPLIGVALGTLIATLFRGIFYMVYSGKHILHISVVGLLFRFVGVMVAIGAISWGGSYLMRYVTVDSYFQWVLWGALVFVVLCLPVALFCRMQLKKIKEKENEADSDCQ